MKKLTQSIEIKATREQVWDAIVNDTKYRKWTAEFHEGSHFEGGWNTGDTIHFIAINEKGEKEGMLSTIHSSIYPEYISIEHRGIISNGVEDTSSESAKTWAPAFENYSLTPLDEQTTKFTVEMDSPDEYYDYFIEAWTKALIVLKQVCE
jgi:hypothetical protein